MNVAALQKGAGNVGLVGVAGAQSIERGFLIREGGQELEGKLGAVKRVLRQDGYSFFDLDWVDGESDRAECCRRQQA